jgi:hypothetical protein
VFGSRLARRLLGEPGLDVVVAGRDLDTARAFCDLHGGRPASLDRTAPDLAGRIAALGPDVVIDAAGPFQSYEVESYTLAWAAVACGAHYLDLSDDADFTAGIAALDEAACARGVVVLSGASSVPALSSAAVEELAAGLAEVHLIESVILPGNRAPRGRSVVRAILAQVGQPLRVWRGGCWTLGRGWSWPRREVLRAGRAPPLRRWSSPIGAPDLQLFPERYRARSVLFRAGLELPVLHWGLWLLAGLVRLRLLRSLEPLAGPVRWVAAGFERWGSDRGGMEVRVLGTRSDGVALRRTWTLVAEGGDGPEVPTLAASVLCRKLLAGHVDPGARPCLGEVSLSEVEAEARSLRVDFARSEESEPPLFAQILGREAFAALHTPLRDLHTVLDERRWTGRASVTRGRSPLVGLICAAAGFPQPGADVPVTITMRRRGGAEVWERDFAGQRFRSTLTLAGPPGSGLLHERFGPVRVEIALGSDGAGLRYPVRRGTVLGLPLPRLLLPRSDSLESADALGVRFDVAVSLSRLGLVIRYEGRLQPAEG